MTSRQLRVLMGLVVAAGLAGAAAVALGPLVGIGILVVGVLAVIAVVQRTTEAEPERTKAPRVAEPTSKPKRSKRGTAAEPPPAPSSGPSPGPSLAPSPTGSFEDLTGAGPPLASRPRSSGAGPEPLQLWTPPESFQTWVPPTSTSFEVDPIAPSLGERSWGGPPDRGAFDDLSQPWDDPTLPSDDRAWDDGSTWPGAPTTTNPLDDLDRLDEVDIMAEVERLDTLVASEATELTVGANGNAELAKLLAKVQQRLEAYE